MPNLMYLGGPMLFGERYWVQRYVMVPRYASAIEIVAVVVGVVAGVLW